MATPLNKFQKGQVLTASALNAVVDFVNDHEKRLQSQQLRPGVGYNFSTSTGGTSLQITPKGSNDEATTSATPFRVSLKKGEFDGGFNYAVSATSGTIFGTSGTSSSYDYIDASDDDHDDEANCKLYTYVKIEEATEYIVFATLYVQALSWGLMKDYGGDDDSGLNSLAGVVSTAVPFSAEFQRIDAEKLSEWKANAHGEIGSIVVGGNALDDYGLGYTYEVHFPLAVIDVKQNDSGELSVGSITQLLHSDIYWYGHRAFSI